MSEVVSVENSVEKVENPYCIHIKIKLQSVADFYFKTFCIFCHFLKFKKYSSKFVSFYENLFYTKFIIYSFRSFLILIPQIINDNQIILENVRDFDLDQTFNCGQCFRWNKITENLFVGVAFEKVVRISVDKEKIVLNGPSIATDFNSLWCDYFDLNTNYDKIKKSLSQIDSTLKIACKYAPGIRILKQDFWEALCSFIISQNNNIPRIKGIIERLCACFGQEIESGFFSFPSYSTIAKLNKSDLAPIKCGFRDAYILDAAQKIFSGDICPQKLKSEDINTARTELMKIKGVGPKVAECTLLYGLHRLDAFPVDVWMKRALETFFPGKNASYFGQYAGIAQQYIFHYSRMNPNLVK